jgi:predicted ATP-grasp superfamily ATP-dependent carboligase
MELKKNNDKSNDQLITFITAYRTWNKTSKIINAPHIIRQLKISPTTIFCSGAMGNISHHDVGVIKLDKRWYVSKTKFLNAIQERALSKDI